MESFEELKVYQEGRILRIKVSELCKKLPSEEKYRLIDQMIRASRSVTAQIAEGFGRFHHQENIQYCRIARGSLSELHEHFNVAKDEGYLNSEEHKEFLNQVKAVQKILNGYINYLKRAKSS